MIPFNLQDPKVPTRDQVVSKVKESGCDAVFVAALLKKDESVHYEPGKTAYAIQPYYTYYSAYYSNWYPTVSTKDYYAHVRLDAGICKKLFCDRIPAQNRKTK